MTHQSETFKALLEASKNHGETKDCTVKALTAATGLDYGTVHKALADQGRKPRKGCHVFQMQAAAKALGFTMTRRDRNSYRAKTMTTAARDPRMRAGSLICETSGHVAAVINGEVIDWTAGRRHRIQGVYEVAAVEPVAPPARPTGSAKWQAFEKYTKADQLALF